MKYIKYWCNQHRIAFIVGILMVIGYFVSRLINLTIIPIFTDEAIYLRWGQLGVGDAAFRLYSLVDGKQPLLIWLFLPALKLIADPLVAGRLVSVFAGFVGMVGFGVLGGYITKSVRGGLIAALLYFVSPFFLMYDRLAIYDSLLAAISVWVLFLSILLAHTVRLDVALLLGLGIGAGLLTKSSAQFYILLLPAGLLLFDWKRKNIVRRVGKFAILAAVAATLGFSFTFILRLSPFYHTIAEKNLTFIFTFSEFFHDPFQAVFGNLRGLTDWLTSYLTVPVVVTLLIALYWGIRKNWRQTAFFIIYFAAPFFALAFFGRVIYPRFILFMTIPLYILLAWFLTEMSKKMSWQKVTILFIALLSYALYFDTKILLDPIHAPLPYADRQQLINDWPSGYGVKESVIFFEEASKKGKIVVGTEGTFGLFPYAFELYLGQNKNVEFRAYWPVEKVPQDLQEAAQIYPTYLVFKEQQNVPSSWPLQLIAQYQRGDGPTYLRVYQVTRQKS